MAKDRYPPEWKKRRVRLDSHSGNVLAETTIGKVDCEIDEETYQTIHWRGTTITGSIKTYQTQLEALTYVVESAFKSERIPTFVLELHLSLGNGSHGINFADEPDGLLIAADLCEQNTFAEAASILRYVAQQLQAKLNRWKKHEARVLETHKEK